MATKKKIGRLTPAQEARMAEFRDKWIAIGLSTAPADRPRAEAAIVKMYAQAKLKAPKIVWCGSPMANAMTRAALLDPRVAKQLGASVWDSVGASVWDSVWASVGASVWASVRASVWDSVWASVRASVGDSVWDSVGASVWASVRASVRASVWDSVWASVRASVWDSVWASVRDSVGDLVWDSVGASVWASVRDSGYGQHDASWLAFYEFFREVGALDKETAALDGLLEQAKAAGWYLPHEKMCFVAERHCVLHRDERGRLHSPSGPACAYPDGWAIYAVHGVRVPADIIEKPASITVDRVEKEQNAEVRRIMIDRYGQARYLLDSGAKQIHADDYGILYRKEIPNDEPLVMVKCVNSTPEPDGQFKDYFLRVDPNVRTAREAIAWTFNHKEEDYAPAVQT